MVLASTLPDLDPFGQKVTRGSYSGTLVDATWAHRKRNIDIRLTLATPTGDKLLVLRPDDEVNVNV